MKDAGKSDNWATLSPAEKKLELFRRQKDLLDTFLTTGAISQAQHDKSLSCLIEKMGIAPDKLTPQVPHKYPTSYPTSKSGQVPDKL